MDISFWNQEFREERCPSGRESIGDFQTLADRFTNAHDRGGWSLRREMFPTIIIGTYQTHIMERIRLLTCFQELDKLVSFSGTPTVAWRRTGEICLVGPEFCMLSGWEKEDLTGPGRRKYIYEVIFIQPIPFPLYRRLIWCRFSFLRTNLSWNTGRTLPTMPSKTRHSRSIRIVFS